jgi:hypothetical protein
LVSQQKRRGRTIEVQITDRKLTRAVCGHRQFHERNSMLSARRATFFKRRWANKEATPTCARSVCVNLRGSWGGG